MRKIFQEIKGFGLNSMDTRVLQYEALNGKELLKKQKIH